VKFCARSGAGGAGSAHFRREKFVAKGGPDGGDGGRGGHIILRGNNQLWTLLHLKYKKHVIASNGKAGAGGRKTGGDGKDVVLEVPLGTVARKADSDQVLFEITEQDQEVILTRGGKGGLGNDHFKTSINQAPRYAQPGEPGIEEWIILELKVLADVGLVGFPNAGKSTLLSVISAATPTIADYPFTTLTPNLGVVPYYDFKSFVVADIPGLIEGASEGKGLGHRFLRHVERNGILLFMIPADAHDIVGDYKILLRELEKYNPELLDKKRLVAISKSDLLDDELMKELEEELSNSIQPIFISALTNDKIDVLKDMLWQAINT
jgi:GTP-binding protein